MTLKLRWTLINIAFFSIGGANRSTRETFSFIKPARGHALNSQFRAVFCTFFRLKFAHELISTPKWREIQNDDDVIYKKRCFHSKRNVEKIVSSEKSDNSANSQWKESTLKLSHVTAAFGRDQGQQSVLASFHSPNNYGRSDERWVSQSMEICVIKWKSMKEESIWRNLFRSLMMNFQIK